MQLLIVLCFFVVFGLLIVGLYNGLVRSRNAVKNAWSSIDVQLKRRHDLIPNVIEAVKGYAAHERQTLDAVITARQQATQSAAASKTGRRPKMPLPKLCVLSLPWPKHTPT